MKKESALERQRRLASTLPQTRGDVEWMKPCSLGVCPQPEVCGKRGSCAQLAPGVNVGRGPLTKDEVDALVYECRRAGDDSTYALVRAVEAAHGFGVGVPLHQTFPHQTPMDPFAAAYYQDGRDLLPEYVDSHAPPVGASPSCVSCVNSAEPANAPACVGCAFNPSDLAGRENRYKAQGVPK